ncbi:MAG: hypothetical protein HYX22_01710 [Candidatus Yanofskybacteria bacterium]|nr:hypothetical protein [Candidatus Yanofskybacteria bacterium]
MFEVVLFFVVGILAVGIGAAIAVANNEAVWLVASVIGAALLGITTFDLAPRALPTGAPTTSIDVGEYALMYVGSSMVGHVDVLTIKDAGTPRTYYRFPTEAFDGDINIKATRLIVVESDGFKKLVLK